MSIVGLPMYDWPEVRADTDAEWQGLRAGLQQAGIDAPERLVRRNAEMPAVSGGILDGEGRAIAPDPATLPSDELDFPTLWKHPALLLAQTCWGPMEEGLARHVVVVGQPNYDGIEGGQGELYSSPILMRREAISGDSREGRYSDSPPSGLAAISPSRGEISSVAGGASLSTSSIGEDAGAGLISPLEGEMAGRPEGGVQPPADGRAALPLDLIRGKRLAYNSLDSMSGIVALRRDLEAVGESLEIFSERIVTAAHRASIVAVAEGRADVCAVDCRSWHLAKLHEPRAGDVVVVGWTARRKGLPYITSRHTPPDIVTRLRAALGRR